MKRQPIADRILVKETEDPADGIWIPSYRAKRAIVLEIGEDVQYVHKGDEILYAVDARGVIGFRFEDENLMVMPEAVVLLVLDRL